jgi:hypothetical protein
MSHQSAQVCSPNARTCLYHQLLLSLSHGHHAILLLPNSGTAPHGQAVLARGWRSQCSRKEGADKTCDLNFTSFSISKFWVHPTHNLGSLALAGIVPARPTRSFILAPDPKYGLPVYTCIIHGINEILPMPKLFHEQDKPGSDKQHSYVYRLLTNQYLVIKQRLPDRHLVIHLFFRVYAICLKR